MFGSLKFYELYHHRGLLPEEAVVLVPQRASLMAFFFHGFWLLYHRLWREAALFFAVYIAVALAAEDGAISMLVAALLQAALQVMLAFSAAELRGRGLLRRGYVLAEIVSGGNMAEAERRYYDALAVRP
jgi:Protein of unknown function (DUF2628)